MAVVTGIWFTCGGVLDIRNLFRRLGDLKANALDDGRVVGHQNLDELEFFAPVQGEKQESDSPEST